ncbi:O-antigen ligase [uncultured Veillonella sp.]|uniref:O-antigen ligase family protein n=1 Tax=uncultured Veillonella sp. TaxID=159268 RepID=UPI002629D5A0|nr:O-antigen ligase family protein [uncultured Veillonella sp.]
MINRYIIGSLILFLVVWAVGNSAYNAAISNAVALGCLFTAFCLFKDRDFSLFKISPLVYVSMGLFYGLIIVASLGIQDYSSLNSALNYLSWVLPGAVVLYMGRKIKSGKAIEFGLITSTIFLGVNSLLEYYKMGEVGRIEGFYGSPNTLGTMFALVLPFLVSFFVIYCKKHLYIGALLTLATIGLASISLYLTASRGAMLGVALGLVMTALILSLRLAVKQHKIIPLIIILAVLGFVAYEAPAYVDDMSRNYDMERVYFWISSLHMWQDSPWFGIGLKNWSSLYYSQYILPVAHEQNVPHAHSMFMWFLSTTGTVGAVGFLAFTIGLISFLCKTVWQQPKNLYIIAMFAAFFVLYGQGLVDAGLTLKPVSRLFFLLLGGTLAMVYEENIE